MPLGASEPKRLAVVEACSGIRSLMTLVTLAVATRIHETEEWHRLQSVIRSKFIAD